MTNMFATTRKGFTLVELLVVMGMIALLMGMAIPSMYAIFTAGADAQAYNLFSAQLTAARALAIQNSTYAGVHVQMADPQVNPELQNACFSGVMIGRNLAPPGQNPVMRFALGGGFAPKRVPGGMAFGRIDTYFVPGDTDNDGRDDYRTTLDDDDLDYFTSLTVVFSPSGAVTTHVEGENIEFENNRKLFAPDSWIAGDPDKEYWVWNYNIAIDNWDYQGDGDGRPGVTAVTLFKHADLRAAAPPQRGDYLDRNGQFFPVNVYTGQLFERR